MSRHFAERFGINTFDKKRMKQRLPYPVYQKWKNATRKEDVLDRETADMIAHAMKTWAIENGATHYCHWFQPLNGLTAKKHDAFLDQTEDHEPIARFSGKELIKGEPDASSFPSGGMRSTFEARGYTYWDCTANTFIVDNIMYIPSIFVSFNGETLDKKGPLLKSMDYLSSHANRVYNLMSDLHSYRCRVKVGLEQEFFLIDAELYHKRPDLMGCGRTLVGAAPAKIQLHDHYFGAFTERVSAFYVDVNDALWELGIYAKTEHNESAPCQFELAVLHDNANISIDNNLMVMEVLKKCAKQHGLVCLLHEKPFHYINGSGKHNNWSIATNFGENLFEPGPDPGCNTRFLLYTSAVIAAVDEFAGLLRFAASGPSNDERLGAGEAPPAIISIYLGSTIENALRSMTGRVTAADCSQPQSFKIANLQYAPHDGTDRNRTSPFAFTGNKFEFRMLGSSFSAADVNIALSTAVGRVLKGIADRLEEVEKDQREDLARQICAELISQHERILFSGDGYSEAWVDEAARRGLPNLKTYRESVEVLREEKVQELYEEADIYSRREINALYNIAIEEIIHYHTQEFGTMVRLMNSDILPNIYAELVDLGQVVEVTSNSAVQRRFDKLNVQLEGLINGTDALEEAFAAARLLKGAEAADALEALKEDMADLRAQVDDIEPHLSRKNRSLPTYEEIFSAI